MNRSWTTVSALALAATLGVPAAASAQEAPHSIRLTPARAEGVIDRGQTIGPFTISNATDQGYRVQVFPVLLGQDRAGGLRIREDAASLRRARRRLAVQTRAFPFPPGGARSVFGQMRRAPRGAGFYGGILFRATPVGPARQQIRNVLQINGRVMLDPPAAQRRVAWEGGEVRAQQDGTRRLRLVVPVTNRGNTFAAVDGVLNVRDASGRAVTTRRLPGLRVLPGATVELPVRMSRPQLPPGAYRLQALLRGAGARARATGAMRLFGVNEVRTELARLVAFSAPRAYIGEETEVRATFRNTGNVEWAPTARLEVRALRGGQTGAVLERVALDAETVRPGQRGEVSGKVRLPEGTRSFDLRVRLLADGRELDARTNSVTPVKRPPLTTRIGDFVTENALAIVFLLLGAGALAAVAAMRYIRRLQDAARR